MARMALAAMDSSESVELPLDYLQGHKDGLEWAARLAEANHPETGDWLYDDPIELAKAIRKGPDMPPAQSVADSEPVIVVGDDGGDALSYRRLIQSFEPGTKLYRHAQPAPVVPDELKETVADFLTVLDEYPERLVPINRDSAVVRALRAAMLPENPVCTCPSGDGSLRWPCPVHPGNSPTQSDCCPAQNSVTPAQNSVTPAQNQGWIPVSERMPENDGAYLCWDNRYVTTYAFIFGAWQANQFIAKNITHWMPLPAAPQEVK
ncbi:TPA: DUF551 domain-containing protein [Klebsiella pneumoniae]|nr:DUF551 domain-containing protein [Klebsiella pneumoniae]